MKNIINYHLNEVELFIRFIKKQIGYYHGSFIYDNEGIYKVIDDFNKNNKYILVKKYDPLINITVDIDSGYATYKTPSLNFNIKFKDKEYERIFVKHIAEKRIDEEITIYYGL